MPDPCRQNWSALTTEERAVLIAAGIPHTTEVDPDYDETGLVVTFDLLGMFALIEDKGWDYALSGEYVEDPALGRGWYWHNTATLDYFLPSPTRADWEEPGWAEGNGYGPEVALGRALAEAIRAAGIVDVTPKES